MGSCIESEHDLVRFLVAPMSELASLAHDKETALRQHMNRRGVVARSASVKRTGCLQLQELLEGTRGNAAAPPTTRPSISTTLFVVELSLLSRTHRLEARSIIGLRRSERGHPHGVAIPRVLEQHAEITIFDLAKDKLSGVLRHGR